MEELVGGRGYGGLLWMEGDMVDGRDIRFADAGNL